MPSALITGANRGLGLEFARQYLANGWRVYATCRHPGSASELQHLAEASDHNLRILAFDVTDSRVGRAAIGGGGCRRNCVAGGGCAAGKDGIVLAGSGDYRVVKDFRL